MTNLHTAKLFFCKGLSTMIGIGLMVACSITSLSAQTDAIGSFNKHVIEKWSEEYVRIGQYRVKGSPYLLGESFPGYISYMNGGAVMDVKILYDIYYQKAGVDTDGKMMEGENEVKEFMIAFPEKFGSEKLLFRSSVFFGHPEMKSYFNVLQDGEKVSLLKAYKTRLIADPTNLYSKDIKIFEQYYEYFLFDKNTNDIQKVKLREREILAALKDTGPLKNYLHAQSMDLSKEKDLIAFITDYNLGLASNK